MGPLILSSVLSTSALTRKSSAPSPRWRLLVKAANGDDYESEFVCLGEKWLKIVCLGQIF